MNLADIATMIFGLAVVLGMFGLGVVGIRRYGPAVNRRLQAVRGERRLAVIETLILDTKSRLVLVRVDGGERLILIGQGAAIDHGTELTS